MGDKETLDKIRQISILNLMGFPHDRQQVIRCPFHDDRTPSLMIKPNNFYKCFGCGKYGYNFIDFCLDMGEEMRDIINEYK